MEKQEKQLTYETPEAEAVECRLESSFAESSCQEKIEGGEGDGCEWD